MTKRRILLIHDSETIRNLVKGFLLSELNDVFVDTAEDREIAEEKIKTETYDVILTNQTFSAISSDESFRLKTILFLKTDSLTKMVELDAQGITNYITPPITPAKLREKINLVCDPTSLRQHKRFSVPGIVATIHFGDIEVMSEVINISQDGFFCEFDSEDLSLNLFEPLYISFQTPDDFNSLAIDNVQCKLQSVKVVDWTNDHRPAYVQSVWLFIDLDDFKETTLNSILDTIEGIQENIN